MVYFGGFGPIAAHGRESRLGELPNASLGRETQSDLLAASLVPETGAARRVMRKGSGFLDEV